MLKIDLLLVLLVLLSLSVYTESTRQPRRQALTEFDYENTAKIVGGTKVQRVDDRYPWFASYYIHGGLKWLSCGGMLITPEYVLTAAHCIRKSDIDNNPTVRIGELCRGDNDNCGQHQEDRQILSIVMNSEFRQAHQGNDFALMRLAEPSTVDPVSIDNRALSHDYLPGKNLYSLGFGHEIFGGKDSNTLKHVELDYVDNLTCASAYPNSITPDMMCAARPGQDACHNDSGGPLFDKEENTVVGIISWGHGCATAGYPGVYSRIATESDWIRTHICSNHYSPLPDFCKEFIPAPGSNSPSLTILTADASNAWSVGIFPSILTLLCIVSFTNVLGS